MIKIAFNALITMGDAQFVKMVSELLLLVVRSVLTIIVLNVIKDILNAIYASLAIWSIVTSVEKVIMNNYDDSYNYLIILNNYSLFLIE